MTRRRDIHRVTCKCVLFSPDGTKVLVVDYGGDIAYGLPGGHIDEGESPDMAMARELFEELGVEGLTLEHTDFDIHHNGKIILGYRGVLDPDTKLVPQAEEMRDALWVSVDDIINDNVAVPSYKRFIVDYLPNR